MVAETANITLIEMTGDHGYGNFQRGLHFTVVTNIQQSKLVDFHAFF
jgi:hypothetical protein